MEIDKFHRKIQHKTRFSSRPQSLDVSQNLLLQQSPIELEQSDTESTNQLMLMSSPEDRSFREEDISNLAAYEDNVFKKSFNKIDEIYENEDECKEQVVRDLNDDKIMIDSLAPIVHRRVAVITSPPTRGHEESDQEFARRLRKHNYLSLAQEFVDRKAAQEEAYQSRLNSDLCNSSIGIVEGSKNKKNNEKGSNDNLSERGNHECFYNIPPEQYLSEFTANHNAIHHHHQRSLLTNESCLHNRQQAIEHLITSPKHAIPRHLPSTRSLACCSEVLSTVASDDLPANVAKMVSFCPPANATYRMNEDLCLGSNSAPSKLIDQSLNRARRHTYCDNKCAAIKDEVLSSAYSEVSVGRFDVYNMETTLPAIDWNAMEEYLSKAVKEQVFIQTHHRSNREEIRRKLAMGSDNEDYYGGERMNRKPSLQTRLQGGMNLQICFMNEMVGDQEVNQETEPTISSKQFIFSPSNALNTIVLENMQTNSIEKSLTHLVTKVEEEKCGDFVSKQAKLQAEARIALVQAKQMAHMQMEVEKQRKKKSPIAEMVGIPFPDGRRKVSRQALCEMNVAQLQVIANDLHTQIESLNDDLVHMLLERDDLHMEQDSMLVDIEDLTRYVGAVDQSAMNDVGHGKLQLPLLLQKTSKKRLLK